MSKPLSFVIITYNRPDDMFMLAENISRLQGLEEQVEEVIIVNNRSSVGYPALEDFIGKHPEIPFRYFTTDENLGVSRGRNYAIQQSKAPILIFLDDDTVFRDTDVLAQILAVFREQDENGLNTGIAAFKVYYYDTRTLQQTAFPHKRFSERKDWHHFDTAYFAGCAHAIRREVFSTVGYYPENFFYGMEEYDLSYRALDAGFRIRYDDRAVILHKESPEGRLTPRNKLRGMWVNKSKVAWKYLPKKYFYTTCLMWSLEYLKKTGWDFPGFLKGWNEIRLIPRAEKRRPVNPKCLIYLKQVKARLTY
ncbi:glycosyltransferase family 2 protein [Flavitalea flava]